MHEHFDHEQCWELIPWVVNGRAGEAEQRALLTHTEDCVECREELERHRKLQRHMRGTDEVIAAPNASWQKLLARIDTQPDPALVKHKQRQRPWLVAALWLQLVAIAALAGALFSSTTRPEYTTLSTPRTTAKHSAVRVVFAPDASVSEVNQLLRRADCDIIAGPSEAGVYTLALANGGNVDHAIATLREHSQVVFAEHSQPVAGSPP